MKRSNLIFIGVLMCFSTFMKAQSVDDILNTYFQNIGGKEALASVQTLKMTGKIKAQGLEFPAVMISKGSKQKVTFTFQGLEIVQPCFDGEIGWQTNFMNMKAEKLEAEDNEIMKAQFEDFPEPFLTYKQRGYTVELMGSEVVEGTDCHKIKMTKKPILIEGKEEENSMIYYFEKENNVPILSKTLILKGPAKGKYQETIMSDYQEVNGLYFPFSLTQKFEGQTMASIELEKIEINTPVDDQIFVYPGE